MQKITELVEIDDRQLAKMCGVVPLTVVKWRYRDKGPAFYRLTGGQIRYKRADVLTWIESCRVDPRNQKHAKRGKRKDRAKPKADKQLTAEASA
jgi:SRSO17 transposase